MKREREMSREYVRVHQGRDRNKAMVVVVVVVAVVTVAVVAGGRRALLLLPPLPILILLWRSARAERLEWREGWLQRSGASPLRGARRRMRRVGRICLRVRGADMESRSGYGRGRGRGRGTCRGWGVWPHCLLVRGPDMGSGCGFKKRSGLRLEAE